MVERIDIIVPEEILLLNEEKKDRLKRTHQFQETDRAPVVVDMQLWALLEGSGTEFKDMIKNPYEHMRGLILNHKYRYEQIHDDLPIPTDKLTIELDFGAIRGVEFPMEVVFHGNDQPKTIHMLKKPEDIDHLEIPHSYQGHNKMRIDWYKEMLDLIDRFDVRLNGETLELDVTLTHMGGPIPSAFALAGSNLFLWMALDPERIHRLLGITTESHMNCIAYLDKLKGVNPNHGIWLGCDTGEMMSAAYYDEFVVPYYQRIFNQYPEPHSFHMCGKIDHILENIQTQLPITYFDGFGFPVEPEKLAETLSGHMVLRGGPHPVLIDEGPIDDIIKTCEHYIRTVGRSGGYILSEGFGIVAGTPPEHIYAMVEASKRVGWIGEINH
jgi:uroporphyrinogen-III decarboxylase